MGTAFEFKTPDVNSCVILEQYGDINCSGEAIGEVEFSTYDEPGSLCYHDATMEADGFDYAVQDQYCNGDSEFVQTVYLDKTCDGTHSVQTYSKDTCLYGMKLKACANTLCEYIEDE